MLSERDKEENVTNFLNCHLEFFSVDFVCVLLCVFFMFSISKFTESYAGWESFYLLKYVLGNKNKQTTNEGEDSPQAMHGMVHFLSSGC